MVRDTVSGGAGVEQHKDEIALLSREDRTKLLASAEFSSQITRETALAMKADLMIPWNKMRIMRR